MAKQQAGNAFDRYVFQPANEWARMGNNILTTGKEISPEVVNMIADKVKLPNLKGFVDKNGQYYESRFNFSGDSTLKEYLLSEGFTPVGRGGEPFIFTIGGNPRYHYSRKNPDVGVVETIGVNPYNGGRIYHYNVSSMSPDGKNLGDATIKRSSFGHNTLGNYKMGNEFDLALTAGDVSTVDKSILKTFGIGIQRWTPKGARITGDGSPSIADKVISNWKDRHYWDALMLAAKRPMKPTYNALSTDSYRYLVGYGSKYPGFTTFYDGLDAGFNSAGVKYTDDITLLRTSPEVLSRIYSGLDQNYPGIIDGKLPHPWIKKEF